MASASSTGPVDAAMKATTFLPCHSSGITGSGGAVVRLTSAVISSGASTAQARKARRSSGAASAGEHTGPPQMASPRVDDRSERMESGLELRDDALVAAAAPQAPEELGVLVLAGADEPAVRR